MIVSEVAYSPGWYFKLLFTQLGDKRRRDRLKLLDDYRRGRAPLPRGAENAREAFEAFCRMARTNFADLIVSALAERMRPVGFRTAGDRDVTGDPEIGSLWRRAGLSVIAGDVHHAMLAVAERLLVRGAAHRAGARRSAAPPPRAAHTPVRAGLDRLGGRGHRVLGASGGP